jgi:hypothetical protein
MVTILDRYIQSRSQRTGTGGGTTGTTLDRFISSRDVNLDEARKIIEERNRLLEERRKQREQASQPSPRAQASLEKIKPQQEKLQREAEEAGSFWGITKETGKNILRFGRDVAQAIPRAIATTTLEAEKRISGEEQALELDPTSSRVGKFVFGKKPLSGFSETGKRELQEFGVGEEKAEKFGFVAGAGLTALDLIPGTGSITKKAARNAAKQYIKQTGIKLGKKEIKELEKQYAKEIAEKTLKPESGKLFSRSSEARQTSSAANEILRRNVDEFSAKISDSTEYAKTLSRQLEESKKGSGIISKLKSKSGRSKEALVDFTSPIEDTFRKAQKEFKYEVRPEFNVINQIDRTLVAPKIARHFTKSNGLDNLIQDVASNTPGVDIFDQYLIARHSQTLSERGIKTGRNLSKDKKMVDDLKEVFEPYAKRFTKYNDELLKYSVDSGLISAKLASKLKKMYPTYVPMNRVFDELERVSKEGGKFNTKAVASLGKQTVIQKIKGSARIIDSPIESILSKTVDAFVQGEKNKTSKMLASYRKLPGWEGLIRKLDKGEKSTGKNVFHTLENGEKVTYETTKEIADAAQALNVQTLGMVTKALSIPTRVLKIGTTGLNVAFIAANVVRDFMFSNSVSKNSARSIAAMPRAFFEALNHGKIYDEMIESGALHTSFDVSRDFAKKTVNEIAAARNYKSNIIHTVTKPSQLFRKIEDAFGRAEEINRIAQFKGAKDRAIAMGMSAKEATIIGAMAARENSVNFMRRGEVGTTLNAVIPYLNAGIQGTRRMLRELSSANTTSQKVEFGTKFALMYGAPMTLLTLYNLRDDKRKEVYDDISEYEKENNFLIITDAAEKNEDGKWDGVIKIPLTPGLGDVAQTFRKSIEGLKGQDEEIFADIASQLLESVSVVPLVEEKDGKLLPDTSGIMSTVTPQAIKPGLEWYVNKNFFTGIPTVPRSMEGIEPEEQIKPNTSKFAIELGQQVGLSPLKIDAFIKGTFGELGAQVTGQRDIKESITRRFTSPTGGEVERKEIDKIIKIKEDSDTTREKLRREAENLHQEFKNLQPEEANRRIKEIKSENKQLYDLILDAKEEDDLNLSQSEKFIKRLGVTNGDRAAYIHSKAMELESVEERNEYIENLIKKKVISENVLKQLKELIALE